MSEVCLTLNRLKLLTSNGYNNSQATDVSKQDARLHRICKKSRYSMTVTHNTVYILMGS